MASFVHIVIYLPHQESSNQLIQSLLEGKLVIPRVDLTGKKAAEFSAGILDIFLQEEFLHGQTGLESEYQRPLHSLSSGEQKKALLNHLLFGKADYFILDELYDHVDLQGQASILATMKMIAETKPVIQLVRRQKDILPFIQSFHWYQDRSIHSFDTALDFHQYLDQHLAQNSFRPIPRAIKTIQAPTGPLVQMKQLCVSYDERPILDQINWTIQAGECWQLKGPNGSGKSTLLSMITGDNPKGYGQDLYLFGMKKGGGETVWDIKQFIGYFNPVMIQHFSRLDSIELMIVSGCMDSIGVYIKPSEMQLRLAKEWLDYLGLLALKNKPIQFLPAAQQRMVLIARAMVKHPPLLILDEPTSGLDDASAAMVIGMIEQIRKETKTTVLFVSHQQEKGFVPNKIFELTPCATGSTGTIV
ncbi:MAG: ABC transporter [Chitinophagaceae bacterium BSSC1]|nr:MAG: ABC transporter [Chitinophagaceae bacterium BSSC1]